MGDLSINREYAVLTPKMRENTGENNSECGHFSRSVPDFTIFTSSNDFFL